MWRNTESTEYLTPTGWNLVIHNWNLKIHSTRAKNRSLPIRIKCRQAFFVPLYAQLTRPAILHSEFCEVREYNSICIVKSWKALGDYQCLLRITFTKRKSTGCYLIMGWVFPSSIKSSSSRSLAGSSSAANRSRSRCIWMEVLIKQAWIISKLKIDV